MKIMKLRTHYRLFIFGSLGAFLAIPIMILLSGIENLEVYLNSALIMILSLLFIYIIFDNLYGLLKEKKND